MPSQVTKHRLVLASILPTLCAPSFADEPAKRPIKELILPGESFLLNDHAAFILTPAKDKQQTPQPWIFYAPTLRGLPDDSEKWMHEQFLDAGVAVAGIDVGESYGCPAGRELFTALVKEMVRRGYSTKPCLLARSRGGLMATSWACDHPEKVSGIAGIYPVFDFRSYPGLAKAAPAYELSSSEIESRAAELNPIERVAILAKAKIPVYLIHGDDDSVVPFAQNSAEFLNHYKAANAGDAITLEIAEGQGHTRWEGFRCQPLIDFAIARARAGAK